VLKRFCGFRKARYRGLAKVARGKIRGNPQKMLNTGLFLGVLTSLKMLFIRNWARTSNCAELLQGEFR
jgi:hypothetical protein